MGTNNKLREALVKILNLTNSLDEDCAVDPVEIRDIARDALKTHADMFVLHYPAVELICAAERRSHKLKRDWHKSQKKIRRARRQRGGKK